MRPPFIYYGGKTRLAGRIAAQLPPHRHYVEPFAGSLAVLLAKEPSPMETANDLDGDLVHFWRVLRDRPEELIWACATTPHSRAEHQAAYEPAEDDIERARRLWVLLTQGRTGRTARTGWRFAVEPKTGSLGKTLGGYVERMAELANRLSRVSLECRPALEVIAAYGAHPQVCLYVDPPYLAETRNGADRYRHEHASPDEHRELLAALLDCHAAVVLSGYDSPLYAEVLDGWEVLRLDAVTTQGRSAAQRVEVLWSNRPLATGGWTLDRDPAA